MIGRVYKITNADESIVYIGSTTQTLDKRWGSHIRDYKRMIDGKDRCHAVIHRHFEEYGVDSFKILLISEHTITERNELFEFEQLTIDRTECVNQKPAYRTEDQRKEALRQSSLKYSLKNKESLKQKARLYREENRELIKLKKAELLNCECGASHTINNRSRHQRTQKHQRWLESQS